MSVAPLACKNILISYSRQKITKKTVKISVINISTRFCSIFLNISGTIVFFKTSMSILMSHTISQLFHFEIQMERTKKNPTTERWTLISMNNILSSFGSKYSTYTARWNKLSRRVSNKLKWTLYCGFTDRQDPRLYRIYIIYLVFKTGGTMSIKKYD